MKKVLSVFCMMLLVVALSSVILSCSSENDAEANSENPSHGSRSVNKSLYCKWLFVGYGSDEKFIAFEKGFIEFQEDGTYTGEIGNDFRGEFSVEDGNKLFNKGCAHSKTYFLDPNIEFLEDLFFVGNRTFVYEIKDKSLRLYYSDKEYVGFKMSE